METINHKVIVISAIVVLILGACTLEPADEAARSTPATPVEEDMRPHKSDVQTEIKRESSATADAVAPMGARAPQVKSRAMQEALPASGIAHLRAPSEPLNRENYAHFSDNPLHRVAEAPFSTFSIDVDTGAYSNMRRMLNAGNRPLKDAIRTEELINYFTYDYPRPTHRDKPFSISTEVGPSPWNPDTQLLHIGIQGYDVARNQLPAANLVFLVDVSGSMQSPDKLELLKSALRLLVHELRAEDRVSIVVYAGASGVVLEPTPGDQVATIGAALDSLTAGGSTNGGAGIRLAYALAQQAFIKDGINRVILATDGDFNVGTVDFEMLKQLVEDRRAHGIGLTTLGFGTGNYNDHLMEQLADAGNGNYAYIDTLSEARKALVDEMSSTLMTIAKDVKIQVEFNPATVAEYRLIGYENRSLAREDFGNDKVDAGEIGAGHSVTAIYEIALAGSAGQRLDGGRYQPQPHITSHSSELALVRLRYKQPDGMTSTLIERPVHTADVIKDLGMASEDYRFAAAVAGFGQILRGGKYTVDFSYPEVLALARGARGADPFGYRGEFLQLANLASSL
ncbi:MAG: VWA domain-containing protein [Gammaproteobacteria bacterium]|nr:MAG: VWA domain-containing protein [Gammaproteobacteria bacterium]